MFALLASSLISPFFFEASSEVRSAYVSLGKLVEDRPMQITFARAGVDTGTFGRFGIRNWDVSSLTDRRADAHRHALYHTEFGPTWQYDIDIVDGWRLKSDITRSWTIYRGFEDTASNRTYHWYQIDQSLENPYLVPFYRLRKCFRGNDYFYFKTGVRRRIPLFHDFHATPSVFAEGGSSRDLKRVLGSRSDNGDWYDGVSSVSFRLELGWTITKNFSAFAFAEQYEIVGGEARRSVKGISYQCAHENWTLGGIGIRMRF